MKIKRQEMVRVIENKYGLESPTVLDAMLAIPRHKFVSGAYGPIAYNDSPVPIGHEQTMSQPYTVAFMTDLLLGGKKRKWKVLEIGTGSGYQAAVLSKLVKEVYSVEIVGKLAQKARKTLKELGYDNVYVKSGDGAKGWKEKAPFDAVIITAGIEGKVSKEIYDQSKIGGVCVAPVGKGDNKVMMRLVKKRDGSFTIKKHGIFHFVPFVEK